MERRKVELISLDKKKDGQVLQDMSLTPEERFVRMFDLIEFSFAFSQLPKIGSDRVGTTEFVLKKFE